MFVIALWDKASNFTINTTQLSYIQLKKRKKKLLLVLDSHFPQIISYSSNLHFPQICYSLFHLSLFKFLSVKQSIQSPWKVRNIETKWSLFTGEFNQTIWGQEKLKIKTKKQKRKTQTNSKTHFSFFFFGFPKIFHIEFPAIIN